MLGQYLLEDYILYPLFARGYITFNAYEINNEMDERQAQYLVAFDQIQNIPDNATKEEIYEIAKNYAEKAMALNSNRAIDGLLKVD